MFNPSQGARGRPTAEELATLNWHTVRRGETLSTIARKLRVSTVELASANNMTTRSRVLAGSKLMIPRPPATLLATRTERAAPDVAASRSVSGTGTGAPLSSMGTPISLTLYLKPEAPKPELRTGSTR